MNRGLTFSLAVGALLVCGSAMAQSAPPSAEEVRAAEIRRFAEFLERLKVSGYLQGQYVDVEESGGARSRDQFSVRRGRIKLTYRAASTSRVVVSVDASSAGTELKDGYVEITEPWTSWKNTLTAGQFNWPFGFEIGYSSSDREVPERSRVVRALFPGERDQGAMFSGRGFGQRVAYQFAVVNGTGTRSSADLGSDKDLVGRLGWAFGPVALGISGYEGDALIATAASPAGELFDKTRWGLDAQATMPLPGMRMRAEIIGGDERGKDVRGWYVYLIQKLGSRHQLAARVDEYDPDLDMQGNATLTTTLAYSFFWDANTKLMLAVEDPRLERNDPQDRSLTARVQYRF